MARPSARDRALWVVVLAGLASLAPDVARAHAPLAPGDVVIVGVRAGSPDTVLVLALVPLHVGDGIALTDDGLRAEGTLRRVEGASYFDVDRTTYPPGTLLALEAGSMSLERTADQIIVYRGVVDGAGVLTGEWLWAMGWGVPFGPGATSNADSALPAALDGRFTELASGHADMAYVGPTTGTASFVRSQVADPANWRIGPAGSLTFPTSFDVRVDRGGPCVVDGECISGDFCVDGTCCDTTCSRESFRHCFGCFFGVGHPRNGTCGPAASTQLCRVGRGACDPQETCDGTLTTCPVDRRAPAGSVCRPPRDACDAPEVCDGLALGCPADQAMPFDALCRPAAGPCDLEERCSGASFACPSDDWLADGLACEPSCGEGTCALGVCVSSCSEPDASVEDGGSEGDGGTWEPDAGAGWDAGHDASVLVRSDAPREDVGARGGDDAGSMDASSGLDAGPEPMPASSCAATAPGSAPWGVVVALALGGTLRRRARRR